MSSLSCSDVEELLLERVSDAGAQLPADAATHLSTCPRCRDFLAGLERMRGALTSSSGAPSPSLGKNLLERVRGDDRFSDLAPEVARIFDVTETEAHRLLKLLRDDSAWMEGPAPGVQIIPIEGGPRIEGAFAAFVRLPSGVSYPAHVHRGTEENLVLQGGFREDSGDETWAGEWRNKTDGSAHGFVAVDGPDCITASVVLGMVDMVEGGEG